MGYHILTIDSPKCQIGCRDGQITCRAPGQMERSLPLEDVASVIITSFSAEIHSHLLLEAAKHGISLILCQSHKPVSLMLPANRSTDTLLTRAQIQLPEKSRSLLWEQTVNAKCQNQTSLARCLNPNADGLGSMGRVTAGRSKFKESTVARYFWGIFGKVVLASVPEGEAEFVRNPKQEGLNSLLNYGYAVLLSIVLQKLFAMGLDPTFGVAHVPRERSTPLAFDLMEPFRPCVDHRVAQWIRQSDAHLIQGVSPEFRKWVTGFPLEEVEYQGADLAVRSCIEAVVRSFRKAVMQNSPRLYKPWIQRNSKWVGSSSHSISPF